MQKGFRPVGSTLSMSGLLGLAFPALATMYVNDTGVRHDDWYPPILQTLFFDNTDLGPPLPKKSFSVAITRDESGSRDEYGGSLTIGGLPHFDDPRVNVSMDARVASVAVERDFSRNSTALSFYYFPTAGITIGGKYYSRGTYYALDTGSPWILLPMDSWRALQSAWDPPVVSTDDYSNMKLDCDAVLREPFCVVLQSPDGDVPFCLNSQDLKNRDESGECQSPVYLGEPGLYILGDPFFKNVVVEHDWTDFESKGAATLKYVLRY